MARVSQKLAQRYAKALFDLTEKSELDRLRAALECAAGAWSTHAELREALLEPHIPAAEKREVLHALGARIAPESEQFARFLFLLLDNKRLAALPAIAGAYAEFVRELRGTRALEVASAAPLTEDERQELQSDLKDRLKAELEIEWVVRPEILGGLQIREGDRLLDGSLAGRLERARRVLSQ